MPFPTLPRPHRPAAALLAGVLALAPAAHGTDASPAFAPQARQEAQIRDIVAHMTLAQKVGQMTQAEIRAITPDEVRQFYVGSVLDGGGSWPDHDKHASFEDWRKLADALWDASMHTDMAVKVPVIWGTDAVHGHNNVVGMTLFPHNIGLGAANDPALVERIGEAVARQVRLTGVDWTFAPTVAVPRDDRWGRTYEGFSEDPAIVAAYAGRYVTGLQGRFDPAGRPTIVATAKHFIGDGGTDLGIDQGENKAGFADLMRIHGAGYVPAIRAGVQTVMASFNSWTYTGADDTGRALAFDNVKALGNRYLLTDLLKGRWGFDGFVVTDWDAIGQVTWVDAAGKTHACTTSSCPAAIDAGADMVMVPFEWKAFIANTIASVQAGEIPMARIDDAVTRILRVKMRAGLFRVVDGASVSTAPSQRPGARDAAAAQPRALARQAVRESLVLLKNNNGLLPLDPRKRILVAGDAADNISRQSGGWTLTWQGTGLSNKDFPGAQSIGAGIAEQVKAAGGQAEIAADGRYASKPDVAVVVFGEDPYAEFQGDLPNLLYRPGDEHDLELLRRLHGDGIPVVAVFLSGRPLWVNREINASDAFVVAWLPGSEGGGVADVLLRKRDGKIANDFHGKLAYAWPGSGVHGQGESRFPFGYGLRYADHASVADLSEASGISGEQIPVGNYLDRGKSVRGYTFRLLGADGVASVVSTSQSATGDSSLRMSALDYKAQEDARRFEWKKSGAELTIQSRAPFDLDRQTNGDVLLVATVRVDALPGKDAWIGMGCGAGCKGRVALGPTLAALPTGTWTRIGVPLKCFRAAGADMHRIDQPFVWGAGAGSSVALARVALGTDADQVVDCAR